MPVALRVGEPAAVVVLAVGNGGRAALGGEDGRRGGRLVGKSEGWCGRRLMGAVFWRSNPGRVGAGALKGSKVNGARVGDGKSGTGSSSSSSSMIDWSIDDDGVGSWCWRRDFCAAAAAKMFLLLGIDPTVVAAVRRGERLKQAIDMGDGSAMVTSAGESICVLDLPNGARGLRFGGVVPFTASKFSFSSCGDRRERLLRSAVEGVLSLAYIAKDGG